MKPQLYILEMKYYLITICSLFMGMVNLSVAGTISVNITTSPGSFSMSSTDLAGAPDVRTDNWNNIAPPGASSGGTVNVTGSSLVYDDGSAVDDSFTIDFLFERNNFSSSSDIFSNDVQMYSGFSRNFGVTADTLTLANIPFSQYDIYVYATGEDADGGRGGVVSLGSQDYFVRGRPSVSDDGTGYIQATTTSYTAGVDDISTVSEANYVLFEDLSGQGQTISMEGLTMGGPYERLFVHGFQIVEVAAAVPEPKTYALLLGIGCLVLVWIRNTGFRIGKTDQ